MAIGDVVRRDVSEVVRAIQQAQKAGRSLQKFGAEIAEARQAFFVAAASSDQRQSAEKRFAQLLQQKDNHLLLMALIAGPAPAQGMSLDKAFAAVSGGELDGGVPKSAQPSFERWVAAMRASIGSTSTATEQKIAQALVDNAGLYEQYKVERDRAEIDAYNNRRLLARGHATVQAAIKAGQNPDGSSKLHSEKIVAFDFRQHLKLDAERYAPSREKFMNIVRSMGSNAPRVIDCAYGPMEARQDGGSWTLVYNHFRFWHLAVPEQLDEMIAASPKPLVFGGNRQIGHMYFAIDKCPATSSEVEVATKANSARLRPLPPAAKTMDERRAESNEDAARRQAKALETRCIRLAQRIEQMRQQAATMTPAQAPRLQSQIRAIERTRAQSCAQ
jgi:hypothetical protein